MVRIVTRSNKIPTVRVQALNRKTGEQMTRTYEGISPRKVIEALDKALIGDPAQAQRPQPSAA